jgi:hypothetical protein
MTSNGWIQISLESSFGLLAFGGNADYVLMVFVAPSRDFAAKPFFAIFMARGRHSIECVGFEKEKKGERNDN